MNGKQGDYGNKHDPHTFEPELPELEEAETDADADVDREEVKVEEVAEELLVPPNPVLLRSQLLNPAFEHTLAGMVPAKLGLEVSERVESEEGRERGGKVYSFFVKYKVLREVSWVKDGIVPVRALNDKSRYVKLGGRVSTLAFTSSCPVTTSVARFSFPSKDGRLVPSCWLFTSTSSWSSLAGEKRWTILGR